ncbi:ATP synthase subunit b 1 [Bienertia sinuspersici]
MEYFNTAKVVRLRSQHLKYLTASEDEEAIKQNRNGSSKNSRWSVEKVDGKPNLIRLKSCYSWKYLSASDEPFLLGWTGKRVLQSSPRLKLDSSVEWEPIKEGSHVKLRTRNGNFLRGNGGVPPWNNSVTHDVPSRSATQDWVLWWVDVLDVDHQSVKDEVEDNKNVIFEESLSRKSSNSSLSTTMEDCYEVDSPVSAPKSARSVRSNYFQTSATPSPRASPTASEKSTRVSPLVHDIRNDSQHSNSFNKLKSMLNGVQDLLNDTEEVDTNEEVMSSETSFEVTPHHPHQLEVKMAKQTLKELKSMSFETLLSSGRDKKMDKSINILIADAKAKHQGQVPKNLANLQNQLKSMRNDRDFANHELSEYTSFSTRRVEIKAQLKKDAAKAHELETLEDGFSNMLANARAKRDELLRQLEEVESSIKAAERDQADNGVQIEELIARIGEKSQSLREMERAEKSWQERKVEAERLWKPTKDEETVKLSRDSSSTNARWSFELVEGKTSVIRLKSCHSGKYLAVSEEQFLLGMTGKRVAQRLWLGPTVEWEPIREGPYVKLKTHIGTFLRVEIDHNKSTNDDSKSMEEIKGNAVPSLPSNVVDQKFLSTEDDGSSRNASSSLENCISFSNLKSMLSSLDDVVVEDIGGEETTTNREGVLSSEVKRKILDFADVQEQLKVMKYDHDLATQDLDEYATFAKLKSEVKAEVDKNVAKASVLEATLETWFSSGVGNSRAKRHELLKQLEDTDSSIKAVEVLLSRIEKRRKRLEDMEDEEESWQVKKAEAERKLDEVEKQWVMIKNLISPKINHPSLPLRPIMEIFRSAKVFRLKCSNKSKYLVAHKDEETVKQSRDNSSTNARWSYELVEGKSNVIRLRSCCTWRYLSATEDTFLLGMTGRKVVQTISQGSTIEWEVIKEGPYIKLQSHIGSTLRANRGPPPWRNSVTHDEPGHWTGTDNMTLWIVDIIVIDYQSSKIGSHDSTASTEEVKRTDVCSSTKHSDSFIKPNSMLASLDDLNKVNVNKAPNYPAQSTLGCAQSFEVKKAKQNFEQLKSSDFTAILSSGQGKKLEKAVDVLITDVKSIGRGKIPGKLINIQAQLKSMKNDHELATQDLVSFSAYSTRRSETRDELKKYAAKAHELEKVDLEFSSRVLHARAKRGELLKQLEEVENNIKNVEKSQADNMVEVDELVLSIEQKSRRLKEIESQEKSWQVRKTEAERIKERVEKDWGKVNICFQMPNN